MKIGLIGDFDASVPAHQAIPKALALAAEALQTKVEFEWIPTEEIKDIEGINQFDGLWCVPASPYKNMDGALLAIKYAREKGVPFLGTCGGFQHAIIEYARNVLGLNDAEHEETAPNAEQLVISRLACPLVEAKNEIEFEAETKILAAYGKKRAVEGYRCNYGFNPKFEKELFNSDLKIGARDEIGEIRAVELQKHPFFIVTLFQPERAALRGELPPLVKAYVQAIDLKLKNQSSARTTSTTVEVNQQEHRQEPPAAAGMALRPT